MLCEKCGALHMIDDSTSEIQVYRCWVCGNRSYMNHPRRSGISMCVKCGGKIEEANVLHYCQKCLDGLKVFKKRNPGALKQSTRLHQVDASGRDATREEIGKGRR